MLASPPAYMIFVFAVCPQLIQQSDDINLGLVTVGEL